MSEAAAGRCSCGTIRGTIESRAGRWTATSADDTAATRYNGHTSGSGSNAFTSNPAHSSPCPTSLHRISARLSNASARAPPYSPNTISGTSSTAPIAPTATTDPVSSFICTGSATNVRKLPKFVISPATHSRRKSTDTRHGARSGNSAPSREAEEADEEGDESREGGEGGEEGDEAAEAEAEGEGAVEAGAASSEAVTTAHAQPPPPPQQPLFPGLVGPRPHNCAPRPAPPRPVATPRPAEGRRLVGHRVQLPVPGVQREHRRPGPPRAV